MQARVIRIDEPDFGCEGKMEEQTVFDRVQLEVVGTGKVIYTKAEDAWLYMEGINEGDLVEVEEETGKIIGKADK